MYHEQNGNVRVSKYRQLKKIRTKNSRLELTKLSQKEGFKYTTQQEPSVSYIYLNFVTAILYYASFESKF